MLNKCCALIFPLLITPESPAFFHFSTLLSGNDRLILSYLIYPVSSYVLPTEYLGIPSVVHISPVLRWSIYRLSTIPRPLPYATLTLAQDYTQTDPLWHSSHGRDLNCCSEFTALSETLCHLITPMSLGSLSIRETRQ